MPASVVTFALNKASLVAMRRLLSALLLGLLLFVLAAQTATADIDKTPVPIPAEAADSMDIALGDMDGDGDLDVALANRSIPSQVFRNDGAGSFTLAWQQDAFVAQANGVKWGDLDGDGDLDLVLIYQSAASQVYRNDVNLNPDNGQTFMPVWQTPNSTSAQVFAIGDLNGDGRLDLIFAASSGVEIYANNGNFSFLLARSWLERATSVDLGDMEGDGDLDIVLAAANVPVLVNQGSFVFDRIDAGSPFVSGQVVRWGDVENDGDLDLLTTYSGYSTQLYLLRNKGLSFELVQIPIQQGARFYSDFIWEDYDGDGDGDLIFSNELVISDGRTSCGCIEVFANTGNYTFTKVWDSSPDRPGFSSVALGDLDMDGDLDIAGSTMKWANMPAPTRSRYYRHDLGYIARYKNVGSTSGPDGPHRTLIADLDGDGDQDRFESQGYWYQMYRNDGGLSFAEVGVNGPPVSINTIYALAAGDMDLDGDLDLALGYQNGPLLVLRNDGSFSFAKIGEIAGTPGTQYDLAWADMDGDRYLDIVVAGTSSAVYRNLGGGRFAALWEDAAVSIAVAVQDVDLDGDTDVAFARSSSPPVVMRNNGLGQLELLWAAPDTGRAIAEVVLGDLDGDALPELVASSRSGPVQVFQNIVGRHFDLRVDIPIDDAIASAALGDMDADGDLDIALAGYWSGSSIWILENHGALRYTLAWRSQPISGCAWCIPYDSDIAIWADMDSDAALDLVIGGDTNGHWEYPSTTIYSRPLYRSNAALSAVPVVVVHPPNTAGAPNGGVGRIAEAQQVPIPFTLSPAGKAPLAGVDAAFSLDGGGTWTALRTTPANWQPGSSTYLWDTFSSGIFGQSDYALFRLRGLPQSSVPRPADSFRYTNTVAGSFQYTPRTSVSTPFRLRGTQVRVVNQASLTQVSALVYRIPSGTGGAGAPIVAQNGQPYRTSGQGWLQGRGEVRSGDRLLALAPVRREDKYTLYHTNGQPQPGGLIDFTVSQAGVQTLTVSPQFPLLLFDLTVSLEWDAAGDEAFLQRLEQDLHKTSAALYDWSDGQVALGAVTVYQDRQQWENADVRIFASNQVRPSANRGGIVSDTLVLTGLGLTEPITATEGEIRIGPEWNRYGDVQQIGDDWPRVLAHEIGHYALFLEDTYLGLDPAAGLLVPVESCNGTAMSDPYGDESSELRFEYGAWQRDCSMTLAELPDWALMTLAYPDLVTPQATNDGPAQMPYAFTSVQFAPAPANPRPLIADGRVPLDDPGLAGGRAYLLQDAAGRIVDLGRAEGTTVLARGARVGDKVCVYGSAVFGCAALSNSTPAKLTGSSLWQPDLSMTPVNTTTLRLRLDGVAPGAYTAVIYPNAANARTIAVSPGQDYLVELMPAATEVVVALYGTSPAQQLVTSYAAGSGPGRARSHDGPGRARSHDGPFTNSDGHVILYPPAAFPTAAFLAVQTAHKTPPAPPGRVAIGRAYYVRASAGGLDYTGGSITFQYFGMDLVLANQPEANLSVYFWSPAGWQRLPTTRNLRQNFASAPLAGEGLYALMSGSEIPICCTGWNLVSYPLAETRTVTAALESIAGGYSAVYSYRSEDTANPWRLFAAGVAPWVNDLEVLEYGRGYWINATQPLTWYVAAAPLAAAQMPNPAAPQSPPATLYGRVTAGNGLTPTAGQPVLAYVDGNPCGQATTRALDGAVVYVLHVAAAGPQTPDCGASGRAVMVTIAGVPVLRDAPWDNGAVRAVDVTALPAAPLTPTVTPVPSVTPQPPDPPTPSPTPEPTVTGEGSAHHQYFPWLSH
jgi:hypothetical protein